MKNNIKNKYNHKELLDTLGVTLDQLQSSVRTQRLSDARAMFAAALMQQAGMSQQKVARILHTTQPGVSLMLKRHECLLVYPHYRALWFRVESLELRVV